MTSAFFNRVKYTAASGGLGDFVTVVAAPNFRTPAGATVPDNSRVSYVAESGTDWEIGEGIYHVGTLTLTRSVVRASTNADAKVNFSAAPVVRFSLIAEDITALGTPSGSLPAGGTTSMVVSRDMAGNGHWRREDGSVNVEDFYPPGFTTPHTGKFQPLAGYAGDSVGNPPTSAIFPSLAAARLVYPFLDDLTPEVDTCALQSAIDYAYAAGVRDIFVPAGGYILSETIFVDAPNSMRCQGLASSYPPNPAAGPRWTAGATFAQSAICIYNGVPYASRQNGNTGHAPRYSLVEDGNDPWWVMYYAGAVTSGTGLLSSYSDWSTTFRGEEGQGTHLFSTSLKGKYINMIAVMGGCNNFTTIKNINVQLPYNGFGNGGNNTRACGFAFPSMGSATSSTDVENCSATGVYSVIRFFPAGAGTLGDNNSIRRCSGGNSYIFLDYGATQQYINSVYDCLPASTIGICNTPGMTNVYGGNWSAEQEGSLCGVYTIGNMSGLLGGTSSSLYWKLGNVFTNFPANPQLVLNMDVIFAGSDLGDHILGHAFTDGRPGNFNWWVIDTPSYGPVPFISNSNVTNALTLFGAITNPGTGGTAGTYRNVAITGGAGSGRRADITVSGGGVTALAITAPGGGYGIGDVLSAASVDIGGCTGFTVLSARRLSLMFAPHWVDTFIMNPGNPAIVVTSTTLLAELQAATTLYATCVVFPFQCGVNADGVFFENANTAMCLFSIGGTFGAPSVFKSGFFDSDPAMANWRPISGNIDPSHLPHYYAQKTIPWIWMNTGVTFDTADTFAIGLSDGGQYIDPVVVYGTSSAKLVFKNCGVPTITFWHSIGKGGADFASGGYTAGIEGILEAESSIAFAKEYGGTLYNNNWVLATQQPVSGVRPAKWSVPTMTLPDLKVLTDPQSLSPIRSINVTGFLPPVATSYLQPFGGAAHKTDYISSASLANTNPGARQSTILFEASHDIYSYHQTLTGHDGGGPGVIIGLKWTARGQSWCVHVDQYTLRLMYHGLVVGLQTDVMNYYIVTGVYPGLGYMTVWKLSAFGQYPSDSLISGSNSIVYSDTKLYAQPYRIKYLSAPPRYANADTLAVTGESIMADTSGGSFMLSLPYRHTDSVTAVQATIVPIRGDKVIWEDASFQMSTNKLLIDGNGSKITGMIGTTPTLQTVTDNVFVTATGSALYKDSTSGWLVTGGTLTTTPALLVTPTDNTAFGGMKTKTMFPSSFTYTLNASSGSIPYTVTGVPSWLTVLPASGTVASGTPVSIVLTPSVGTTAIGVYTASLTFTNTTTGRATTRKVTMVILGLEYTAEGDSITAGALTTNGGYPNLYAATASPNVVVHNISVSSSFLTNLQSRLAAVDSMIGRKRTGDVYVLSVMAGTNDVAFGYTGGTQLAYFKQFAAYLDHCRAAGWYIILGTQISRGQPPNVYGSGAVTDTELIAFNAELRTWTTNGTLVPGRHADVICDFASIPELKPGNIISGTPVYANPMYYEQQYQTHPTDAGQVLMKNLIGLLLDTGLGLSSNAFGIAAGTSTAHAAGPVSSSVTFLAAGTSTAASLGVFNPTSLFVNPGGGQYTGGWWDPSDLTTMFQDTSGTIAVTAPNQPVALIRDKSGNAVHLGSGGPPTLKNSGALWWLEFDGVANRMGIAAAPASILVPATRINGLRQIGWVAFGAIFNTYPNFDWLLQQQGGSTSPTVVMGDAGSSLAPDSHLVLGTDHVTTEVYNGASSSFNVDHLPSVTGTLSSTATAGLTVANSNFGANNTNIRWYGGIWIGRLLTALEKANCQTFFGAKAGVTPPL